MAQRAATIEPKPESEEKKNDEQTPEEVAQRNIPQPSDNKESSSKKPGIFANLTQQAPPPSSNSILFNNTNVDMPKSLFGNEPPKNLFSTSSGFFGNATGGLFGTVNSSLFNNTDVSANGGSIFGAILNSNQAPAPASDGEDGDDGEDGEGEKSDDEANKEIIMKYEYKKPTEQVVKYPLSKFRRNKNEVIEKGSIAIEKVVDQEQHVVIYRNHIQNILYQGVILKKLAKVGPLNEKKENLLLKTVSKSEEPPKEGENGKPFQVDTLKLMFELADDAAAFETEFKKHIQE